MWPIDLVRRANSRRVEPGSTTASAKRREAAVLLVRTVAGRQVVVHCCEQATARGVRPGLNLSHARALLPPEHTGRLLVAEHDPYRDSQALHKLALWATRYFSPRVSPDKAQGLQPPEFSLGFGLLMDITGCQGLFRGERRLLHRVASSIRRLGAHCRVASAPTFGAAWAVSHFGPDDLAMIGRRDLLDALRPLPVEALRLEPQTVAALHEVAITTIGHLLPIPRGELRNRFGEQLVLRLDQAVGDAPETIDPVRPIEPPRAVRVFDGPVKQLEAVTITVRELLADLCTQMLGRQCGARQVELRLQRVDAPPIVETAALSRPGRDARHLWALLGPRVEKLNLGFGVDSVELVATRTGRLRHEQAGAWTDRPDEKANAQVSEMLDVLANRLGHRRVLRAAAQQSHIPERRFQWTAATESRSADRAGTRPGSECVPAHDRPTMLLDPPQPASVVLTTPEGPVLQLSWRGELHRVVTSIGPERIEPEWWRALKLGDSSPRALPPRDYYRVQTTAGAWLWLFRDLQSGRWSVHGVWS